MPAMLTPSKPVLCNRTIAGMPNKTHEGIFLDVMLRKGTSYNGIKTTQNLVKPHPKHKKQSKNDNRNP